MIDSFKGEYAFLSNFYEAPVEIYGLRYRNNEAAFQAQKVFDESERKKFTTLDARSAKKLGRTVPLRWDWEDVKLSIMYDVCYAKFTLNPQLAEKLIATGDELLVEGNTWNDRFWGVYNGEGRNHLGKILMQIRAELQNPQKHNASKCDRCFHNNVCEKKTCVNCGCGPCDECELYSIYDGKPDIENCESFVDRDSVAVNIKPCVVVVNRTTGLSPVRHIIFDQADAYNEKLFQKEYYKQFNKLKGDEFYYFISKEKKDAFIATLEDE